MNENIELLSFKSFETQYHKSIERKIDINLCTIMTYFCYQLANDLTPISIYQYITYLGMGVLI